MRIGLLSNLRAGGSGARVRRVLDYLVREHPDVAHVETEQGHGAGEALGALAAAGVDLLVVNGGDGTLQRALTEILSGASPFATPPLVAPLRSGRTSASALDIGSHRDPRKALELLLARAAAGSLDSHLVRRSVLRVHLEPENELHCCMFFGGGVIYRAIHLTHRIFPHGRAQGVFGSSLVTGALVLRAASGAAGEVLAPDRVDLRLNGEPVDMQDFQLLIASGMERMFLHLRPFWGTGDGPVRVTALAPGTLRNLPAVVRILRGKSPTRGRPDPRYLSRNVELAEMTMDCGLTLDGENYDPVPGRRVRIEGDRRVRFVSTR